MGFGWNINEYLDPENNDIDELLFLILCFLLIEHSSMGRIDAEKLYCVLMIAIIVLLFLDLKEELKDKSNIDKIASFKKYVVQKTSEIYKNKSFYKTKNTLTQTTKRNYFTAATGFKQYTLDYLPLKKLNKIVYKYLLASNELELETANFFSLFARTKFELASGLTNRVEIVDLQKKLYFLNFWSTKNLTYYILTIAVILRCK